MMRKSKLEKMIRNDFRAIVPKEIPSIQITEVVPYELNQTDQPKRYFQFSRVLVMTLSLIIVLALSFSIDWGLGLISRTTTTQTTQPVSSTVSQTDTTDYITQINAKDFAVPIVTASKLSANLLSSDTLDLLSEDSLLIDNHMELINDYVYSIETMLSFETSTVVLLESDRYQYEYLLQMSTYNALGNEEVYHLYYNVTESDEEETEMEGIAVFNLVEHKFLGIFKDESGEQELEIMMFVDETEDSYIKSQFSIEKQEHNYEFEHVVNGIIITSSEVEIEFEDDESKVSVYLQNETETIEFEIKKEMEEEIFQIVIDYEIETTTSNEIGFIQVEIIVDVENNGYSYRYYIESGSISKTIEFANPIQTNHQTRYPSVQLM